MAIGSEPKLLETGPLPALSVAVGGTGGTLYGLLDAARSPEVLSTLRADSDEHESLYEGKSAVEMADFAPYLVRFPELNGPLLRNVLTNGWGESWGVFLSSEQSFLEVRRHFRKFLMVQHPEHGRVYFRFYDPRVLRVFLPCCEGPRREEFFGPVDSFWAESEGGAELLGYGRASAQSFTRLRLNREGGDE